MRHGVDFTLSERHTGRSPLHIGAKLGNPDLVQLLLDCGLPVNSLCRFGSTALHWAVRSGSLATCSTILAWNRPSAKLKTQDDSTEEPFEAMLGSYGKKPMIPLTEAALPVAATGLESAREIAWINVVEEQTFATPLHLAARKDRGDMVAMLLHYAYLCDDRDMSDTMGYKHNRMANRSAKSLVNARTREGSSLLHYLSDSGHVDLLNWCLQHGGIVDIPNKNGQTPLFWAAFADKPKAAQLLLLRGADLHIQDKLHANTPLHTAAMKGSLACIKVLVRDGGDVSRLNKEGLTPVRLARATGHFECADWMEGHAFERYSTFKQKKRQSIWTPQIPEFAADRTKVRSGSDAIVRRASFMGESRQKAPTLGSRASSRLPGAQTTNSGPFGFSVPKDRPRSMMLHTKFRLSAIGLRAPATVSDSSLSVTEELEYPATASRSQDLQSPEGPVSGSDDARASGDEEGEPVPTIAVLEDAAASGWTGPAKRQGINTERWQPVTPLQGALPADCEPPPPAPW